MDRVLTVGMEEARRPLFELLREVGCLAVCGSDIEGETSTPRQSKLIPPILGSCFSPAQRRLKH